VLSLATRPCPQHETMRYCEVGSYYKSRIVPMGVVGSTSHFTILFGGRRRPSCKRVAATCYSNSAAGLRCCCRQRTTIRGPMTTTTALVGPPVGLRSSDVVPLRLSPPPATATNGTALLLLLLLIPDTTRHCNTIMVQEFRFVDGWNYSSTPKKATG
jgi:hypothetical protein